MTPEEQAAEDERARHAADAQMRALAGLGERTASALAPVTGAEPEPPTRRVELPPDPELDAYTATGEIDAPEEAPTRDHLGRPDSSSGSVFGPDYDTPESILAAGGDPNAEIYGTATDSDPTFPGYGPRERAEAAGDRDAEVYGEATDSDPMLPGSYRSAARALAQPYADEPEAVDNPTEEEAEAAGAQETASPEMRALGVEKARGELPRLDAGLPTEEEIGRAHTADDWRRPFHALGAGLLAAAGRAAPAFEESAAPLEAERRAGLRQALEAKAASRATEATQAATSARQQAQDALAERRVAAAEALVPQRLAQAEAQAEATRARTGLTTAQTAHLTSSDEMRGTPEERDQSARMAWRAGIDRLPAGPMRDRLAALYSDEDLSRATAASLAGPLDMLERLSVGVRAGGGGGVGGSSTTGDDSRRPSLEAAARSAGITPEIVAASSTRELADLVHRAGQRAPQAPAEGQRFTVAAPAGAEPLQLSSDVYSDPVSQRSVRDVLEGSRQIAQQIGVIDSLRRQYSPLELATPGTAGNAAATLAQSRLATAQSRISNAGTINAGEREIYIGDAPPAFNFLDFLTGTTNNYDAMVNTWRQILEGNIDAIAEGGGVEPSQMARWRSYYTHGLPRPGGTGGRGGSRPAPRSTPTPAAPAASHDGMRRVRVTRPDGSVVTGWAPIPEGE